MDTERCEKQNPIEFRCKKILPIVEKMDNPHPAAADITEIDQKKGAETIMASPTPQKPEWRSKVGVMKAKHLEDAIGQAVGETSDEGSPVSELSNRSLKGQIELPDKYKTLANLFNRMESSIRLLALRNKLPIFPNISTQVEILAGRKFLSSHLAQMKSVFPEAIHIEKILVHDAKSLCMKPEMKITLVLDAVESPSDPDQSASMALCQAFSAKLLELFHTDPKGAEIPEALLPEPFNRITEVMLRNASSEASPLEVPQQASLESMPLPRASHFAPAFCRPFSQKVIVPESQLTQLLASQPSSVPIKKADNGGKGSSNSSLAKSSDNSIKHKQLSQGAIVPETQLTEPLAPGPILVSVGADNEHKESSKQTLTEENLCSTSAVKFPDEVIRHPMTSQFLESTPVKYDTAAAEMMLVTPVLQAPQRPIPTPYEKLVMEDRKLVPEPMSTSSVRRSLKLPSETDGSVLDSAISITEPTKAVEYSGQQTATAVRHEPGEEIGGMSPDQPLVAGVGAITESEDHMLREVRQNLLVCLPNMFDTICLISQSLEYKSITKEELVHKIILNNLEVEDRREVEEQLTLLEELASDWIYKKAAPTGDYLYCFKRTPDLQSIRAMLVKAGGT